MPLGIIHLATSRQRRTSDRGCGSPTATRAPGVLGLQLVETHSQQPLPLTTGAPPNSTTTLTLSGPRTSPLGPRTIPRRIHRHAGPTTSCRRTHPRLDLT